MFIPPLSRGAWGGGRGVRSMYYSLRGQTFHFHSISSSWVRILFEFQILTKFQIFQNSWFWLNYFFSQKLGKKSETHTQASLYGWLSESEVSEFWASFSGLHNIAPKTLPKSWKSEENPRSPYCPNRSDARARSLRSLALGRPFLVMII